MAAQDVELTPESIIDRLETAAPPQCMEIPFQEVRHYQLKKTDMIFQGTMRMHPDHGISIEYTDPVHRLFILNSGGLRIRQPDTGVDTLAPEEAGVMMSVFTDLLTLNKSRLEEQFSMIARAKGEDAWLLELSPGKSELRRYFMVIELEGAGDQLQSIYLQKGRSRWQRIEFKTRAKSWDPTLDDLKTYF